MEREESATTLPKKIIVLLLLLYFCLLQKQTDHKQLTITFTTSVSFIAFYIEEIDYSYVLEKRITSKHVATQEQLHIVNLDSIVSFGELQYQHLAKNRTDPMISFTIFSI